MTRAFNLSIRFAVMFSLLSVAAYATEPTDGIVYNTKESSALKYSCTSLSNDKISCQFTQTSVRQKMSQPDLEKRLEYERRQFLEKKIKLEENECKWTQQLKDAFAGKGPFPDDTNPETLSQKSRPFLESGNAAALRFCQDPSLENWISFNRIILEKDVKTCLVFTNPFTQELTKSTTGAWSVIPKKTGECGLVQLSRFEPEIVLGITLWNYIARKAVTNPSGTFGLGQSCSSFDQSEYSYSWKRRELDINCDFIEFSPL